MSIPVSIPLAGSVLDRSVALAPSSLAFPSLLGLFAAAALVIALAAAIADPARRGPSVPERFRAWCRRSPRTLAPREA